MTDEELTEWIIDHAEYLLTIKEGIQKVNLYRFESDFYEIYFDPVKNAITKAAKVSDDGMKKFKDR